MALIVAGLAVVVLPGTTRAGATTRAAATKDKGLSAHIAKSYGTGEGFCNSGTSPSGEGGYALGANFDNVWACGPPIDDNVGNTNFEVPPFDTSVVGYQCAEIANRWLYHATGQLAYADGNLFAAAAHTATGLPLGYPGGNSLPRPGDILSMGSSSPGHVVVIDGASASLYTTGTGSLSFLDENAEASGTGTLDVKNFQMESIYGYAASTYYWLEIPGFSTPVPANGSFVAYGSAIFRIAGGAPLYVANWANVGGSEPSVALTAAQWAADGFSVGGPHQYPANGTEVAVGNPGPDHGTGYVFAGGAPLAVTNWSNVSAHPSWTVVDENALFNYTGALYDHARLYPQNGTEVAIGNPGPGHGTGFVFAGGAPLAVTNWSYVSAHPSWTFVDGNALDRYTPGGFIHVRQYPLDGTEVAIGNPQDHGTGFVFAGGAPLAVTNWAYLSGHPAWVVVDGTALNSFSSTGAFSHVLQYPINGTAVAVGNPGSDHGAGYLFAGGAPLPVAKWSNVGSPAWVVVDATSLNNYSSKDIFNVFGHVRPFPFNGTFLKVGVGAKKGIWRTGGGYAFGVTSCSRLTGGCTAEVLVDGRGIQTAGTAPAHLLSAPVNGTVVEGMPSKKFWVFSGGKRKRTSSKPSATQVSDASLTRFKIA